jgi:tetratricopeptide (TPR) repeat protein
MTMTEATVKNSGFAPKGAKAYFQRGLVYALKYDYDNAIADYTRAVEFDANHAAGKEALGLFSNSVSY